MLRGLVDEANDGLIVLDEDGIVLVANTAAATMLGRGGSGLVGKPLGAGVAGSDRRLLREGLRRLGAGERVLLDLRLLHGGGSSTVSLRVLPGAGPRRIAVAISPERPAAPTPPRPRTTERVDSLLLRLPYAVVGLHRDFRVAFANAHARSLFGPGAVRIGAVLGSSVSPELRALAKRLVAVPEPLAPIELALEDDRAVRVSGLAPSAEEPAVLFIEDVSDRHRHDRVMHEFLRNAAHQLRTPVAGITAAVEMLQSGAKERPAERDRFLAHVERHAGRLTRVARGVLLLSRAQDGEPAPVDFVELRPLLDRLVDESEQRDGVTLLTDCPFGLAAIAAPDLLHEALAALLDNALTHTSEGEVRISATQTNGRVVLTVSDQGPGIPPELVDRVFEPFFRATTSGDGYGLGLAIAAQAVETMGGEIDVSSSVGAGTSFTVKLPSATVVT